MYLRPSPNSGERCNLSDLNERELRLSEGRGFLRGEEVFLSIVAPNPNATPTITIVMRMERLS